MVKLQIKCATAGCHRRKKVSFEERQRLREEGEKTGQQTGLICPSCVKQAFEDPDEYDLDIPSWWWRRPRKGPGGGRPPSRRDLGTTGDR